MFDFVHKNKKVTPEFRKGGLQTCNSQKEQNAVPDKAKEQCGIHAA